MLEKMGVEERERGSMVPLLLLWEHVTPVEEREGRKGGREGGRREGLREGGGREEGGEGRERGDLNPVLDSSACIALRLQYALTQSFSGNDVCFDGFL